MASHERAIDWENPDVQKIYSDELRRQIDADKRTEEEIARLRAALDALPELTMRQKVWLEATSAYWALRDAIRIVRRYP